MACTMALNAARPARAAANSLAGPSSRPSLLRVGAPAPARASVLVRAAKSEGLDIEDLKARYDALSASVPPVLTAATLPVIALSLLCKTLTGSGLPGWLGLPEGLAFLILPVGLGSFLPIAADIVKSGDFSQAAILEKLTTDPLGKDATERTAKLKNLDPNSPLAQQMKDLEARKAKMASLTPEQIAAKEELKRKLAAEALGVGQVITDNDDKTADREKLLATPVVETLKNCMTTDNYGTDVTSFKDEDLDDKLNLSTPDIESGAPVNNAGDQWREQYRVNKKGKSE